MESLGWNTFDPYCPPQRMGEIPSPLSEDFSRLAVWNTTVVQAMLFMI
jgi:hypothetical protein